MKLRDLLASALVCWDLWALIVIAGAVGCTSHKSDPSTEMVVEDSSGRVIGDKPDNPDVPVTPEETIVSPEPPVVAPSLCPHCNRCELVDGKCSCEQTGIPCEANCPCANKWREVYHNGRWWYYHQDKTWSVWDGKAWVKPKAAKPSRAPVPKNWFGNPKLRYRGASVGVASGGNC